mgnify:CR=1 FL=1
MIYTLPLSWQFHFKESILQKECQRVMYNDVHCSIHGDKTLIDTRYDRWHDRLKNEAKVCTHMTTGEDIRGKRCL